MSSNNTSQNDANPNGQRQQNAAASSSGVGAILSGIFSRGSPAKQSQRLPQVDTERKDSAKQTEEEWEDVPERSSRTSVPPKSIIHLPSTPSREHRVSFEGDRRSNSDNHSRKDRSRNGSSRTGRGVDDFVAQNLHGSGASRGSNSNASHRPARPSISPTQRQPVSPEAHPLANSHYPPNDVEATFLDPGNSPLGAGDFDASRPLTPDVAWGEGEREALGMGTSQQPASQQNADSRGAPGPQGFEIETIPPFELDPHSPLAEQDPNFVPTRTIGQRTGSGNGSKIGTPPRPPVPGQKLIPRSQEFTQGTPPRQPGDAGGDFQIGTKGLLRADANVAAENAARRRTPVASGTGGRIGEERYSPRQPHREAEIGPRRKYNPPGEAGPSNHRRNRNPPKRPGPVTERERRERERQRKLASTPFRPQDPYAYPVGEKKSPIPPFLGAMRWAVDWAEERFGLGAEDDLESGNRATAPDAHRPEGEEIPMSGRKPAWMQPRRRRRKPAGRPAPANETEAQRLARERGENVAHTSRVDAHRLEREIQQREERLVTEREERERHRRMTDEEIKDELEHGLPVVPRTSPTRAQAGDSVAGATPRIRPVITPHPGGTESAPVGRIPGKIESSSGASQRPSPIKEAVPARQTGTLSPPKASPDHRPSSDPCSPVKHTSPFNLNVNLPKIPKPDLGPLFDAEKQVELTLRQWTKFALVQFYRHLLLRMPSLYFNRVGRVFTEADFSEREIAILLNREEQDGPNSYAARVMDRRSPWRGFGGLSGVDDDSEPLLSDGRDSNSPSPNQRPLPLANANGEDQSDLDNASMFGGGSTLAGQGGNGSKRTDPELKRSLAKLERFRIEWESFIDGMVKEWKTLNVISALLLSALLTVFQIGDAAYVPITRTAALLSLISAFMSLLFGGMYIIRFSTMRTMRKAARWVEDTHKKKQKLLWNIWILLSLPVTWLVYSLLFFCITILGFIWTSGTGTHTEPPTDDDNAAIILGPRIGVTVLFFIGFVYFCLVLNTFRVWSGVTISSNNDTLINLHSPNVGAGNQLETSALAAGGRNEEQSPPALTKGVHELDTFVPAGTTGLEALAPMNAGKEGRQQRKDDMIRGLESRGVGRGSVGSAPSVLGLDLTPAGANRLSTLRYSPNLLSPELTATPPKTIPVNLQPPSTIITQPTPVDSTFQSHAANAAPLTATDPRMDPSGPWGLQDPLPVNSPPFTRHSQALDLDDGLPDRRTPPSLLTSVYATPREESVSEFGTIGRPGGRLGRGS